MIEPLRATLERHPAVRSARLAGSRGRGGQLTPLSDWDIVVDTDDFAAVAADLPVLSSVLRPLAQQWDPYASEACYMLMLRGAVKVDVIFPDVPHESAPPWEARPDNLEAINLHFWDWILWLASKQLRRDQVERVEDQFELMSRNLLRPLGVPEAPGSIEAAVAAYVAARDELERRFDMVVSRAVEEEVLGALGRAGFPV